jgi:hypothetical protein
MSENTMTLLCPHNMPLFVIESDGMYHYVHENKSGCDLVNYYDVTADKLLFEMGKLETTETQIMRVAFCCSLTLRLSYYKTMAQVDTTALQKFLRRIMHFINSAHNKELLLWELNEVFGSIIFENFYFLEEKTYQRSDYIPDIVCDLPTYDIPNLANHARDRGFLELEAEVQRANRNSAYRQINER